MTTPSAASWWATGYCANGHQMTPDNIYTTERVHRSGNRGVLRNCRRCRTDRNRERRQKTRLYDPAVHDMCMDCGPIPRRKGGTDSLYCRACQKKREARQRCREADARAGGYL